MTIDLSTVIAIALPAVGAIVWLIRLEGRVNVEDARYEDIIGRLERIEAKLDRSNRRH